jgi:hypothetical protein
MRKSVLLLLLLLIHAPAAAQDRLPPVQVFLQQSAAGDRLHFIDLQTGETTITTVSGQRYTLFGRGVMFYDPAAGRVRLATPDGRVRAHPFIQPLADGQRVDWALSADGQRVAWTLTTTQADGQITTLTQVAHIDGSSPRQALVDGPRAGIRVLPLGFSADGRMLYFDYQPDGIGDLTPFRQYAGLFALDLETGATTPLPGEPGCFCGAGLGNGLLLRLALTADLRGFDAVLTNLGAGTQERIPALRLANYTLGGGILFAPDQAQAVYVLAQVRDFGGANFSARAVYVLVDLIKRTQTILTGPVTVLAQPVAWADDGATIIFASVVPGQDGTWKIGPDEQRLIKVAEATYLGTLE